MRRARLGAGDVPVTGAPADGPTRGAIIGRGLLLGLLGGAAMGQVALVVIVLFLLVAQL